jgi:hypothetical protein
VSFDATPSAAGTNAVIGLSKGAQTAYTGFATAARFSPTNVIDARNGSNYAATTSVPYKAGVSYHFRQVVNVASHTYSLYVTPAGGSELTVASNFAFRTEQASVTSLSSYGVYAETGSDSVCHFNLGG